MKEDRLEEFRTNIMLDLECASVDAHNPVILQIGAVQFDETGVIHSEFSRYVNWQSCIDKGLVVDKKTLDWINRKIPGTKAKSERSPVSLKDALDSFTQWLANCRTESFKRISQTQQFRSSNNKKVDTILWANGMVTDISWMRSAYQACGMEQPWAYWSTRDVRTTVKDKALIIGHDYSSKEVTPFDPNGKEHDAIDDCKHQIKYYTNALKAEKLLWAEARQQSQPTRSISAKYPSSSFSTASSPTSSIIPPAPGRPRLTVSAPTSFSENHTDDSTQASRSRPITPEMLDKAEQAYNSCVLESTATPRDTLQNSATVPIRNRAHQRLPENYNSPMLLKRKSDAMEENGSIAAKEDGVSGKRTGKSSTCEDVLPVKKGE